MQTNIQQQAKEDTELGLVQASSVQVWPARRRPSPYSLKHTVLAQLGVVSLSYVDST